MKLQVEMTYNCKVQHSCTIIDVTELSLDQNIADFLKDHLIRKIHMINMMRRDPAIDYAFTLYEDNKLQNIIDFNYLSKYLKKYGGNTNDK